MADWFLGKYKTIFYLSLVYCVGHAFLAIFENKLGGFTAGLLMISMGAGGIKPCVSANVGDQFDESNKSLIEKAFSLFYLAINFGSLISTYLIPYLNKKYGPAVAFGVPGVLMFIATVVFWLGRKKYRRVPPAGYDVNRVIIFSTTVITLVASYLIFDTYLQYGIAWVLGSWLTLVVLCALIFNKFWFAAPGTFIGINLYAMLNGGFKGATTKYGEERVDGIRSVWKILALFSFIPVFWALYDQNGSEWVLQAQMMNRSIFGFIMEPEQIQLINPLAILILTPLITFFIYPKLKLSATAKVGIGFILTAISFVFIAIPQETIDTVAATIPAGLKGQARLDWFDAQAKLGNLPSIGWQLFAYFIITIAEILISITGLEYAYTRAPASMKATIMSCWLLTVTIGNVIVSQVNNSISNKGFFSQFEGAKYYWLFMGICIGTTIIFFLLEKRLRNDKVVLGA